MEWRMHASAWACTSWSSVPSASSTACAARGAPRNPAAAPGVSAASTERRKRALRCTRTSPAAPRRARSSMPLRFMRALAPAGLVRARADTALSRGGTRACSRASRMARSRVGMRPLLRANFCPLGLFCIHVVSTPAAALAMRTSVSLSMPMTASSPPALMRSLALSMDSVRYSTSSRAATLPSGGVASSSASLSFFFMVTRSPSPRITSRNSR
mmetsp:Transcript_19839/g.58559  ORF Transcript_19839/g.58559 Transcript_19839/m.58559 type:complete len:214 (-) Transcript_19839:353-994(-)